MLGLGAAAQAPPVEDLPLYQHELEEVLHDLGDASFAEFADQLVTAESEGGGRYTGVDWDVVFRRLRDEAGRREGASALEAELAYRHGASLVARGSWARADEALVEALDLLDASDLMRGWILISRAQVAASEHRWTRSLELLDEAERLADDGTEGDRLRAWVQRRRDEVWVLIGMPELALDNLRARWRVAVAGEDQGQILRAFEQYANGLAGADDFEGLDELERELEPLLAAYRWSPAQRATFECYLAIAEVDGGLRSAAAAQRGRARLEALLEGEALDATRRRWCLEWLAQAHLEAGRPEEALEVVTRLESDAAGLAEADDFGFVRRVALRARAELGLNADHEVLEQRLVEVRAAWDAVREGWSSVPTRDGGVGYLLLSLRQGLIEALLGLLHRTRGPERGAEAALEWLVEAQALSTLARRLEAPPTTFADARRVLLGPRRGLLAWVPLRGITYLLAADAERARLYTLGPSYEIEGRVSELLDALAERLREPETERAPFGLAVGRATAALLPPESFEFVAPWSELYLCGLDDLGLVPFELLDDGSGGTQGTRRAVARLPSIPVGLVLRGRAEAPAATGVRVLVADEPEPEAARRYGLESLRTGGAERGTLYAGWGGYRLETLAGEQASFAGLARMGDAQLGLTHVLGHGVRRLNERPQGILLWSDAAGGGAVFAEDIETLRAPPLVLLSVCGANRSRVRRGDGSRSDLTAAWYVAGAAATASASTDLELGPTLRVGALVHSALRHGASLAEALREARSGAKDERDRLTAHLLQVGGAGLDARLPAHGEPGSAALWLTVVGTLSALALAWLTWSKRARPGPRGEPGALRAVRRPD